MYEFAPYQKNTQMSFWATEVQNWGTEEFIEFFMAILEWLWQMKSDGTGGCFRV